MTDDLELLIAAMAREAAHHHQCSLATARCQIRSLVAAIRAEYRAAGRPTVTTIAASDDDDDCRFCRWLLARPRLTPAA